MAQNPSYNFLSYSSKSFEKWAHWLSWIISVNISATADFDSLFNCCWRYKLHRHYAISVIWGVWLLRWSLIHNVVSGHKRLLSFLPSQPLALNINALHMLPAMWSIISFILKEQRLGLRKRYWAYSWWAMEGFCITMYRIALLPFLEKKKQYFCTIIALCSFLYCTTYSL